MREIRINNSRLVVRKLNYSKGDSTISLPSDKRMKYKRILFTHTSGLPYFDMVDARYKGDVISLPFPIRYKYSEAYAIFVEDEYYKDVKYSQADIEILAGWVAILCKNYLDTTEKIIHAIGNDELADKFYRTYGIPNLNKFVAYLNENHDKFKQDYVFDYPVIYSGYRYSIEDLAKDLAKNKVEIYINPELIGEYNKISRSADMSHDERLLETSQVVDDWFKVINTTWNRTRANLSLEYLGKVNVTIPENEAGVKPEKKVLNIVRNFCLVSDGMLNMKEIAIKTTNKKLKKRLKLTKVFKDYLMSDDEFILDLTKLPVTSGYSKLKVSANTLGNAEINIRRYEIICRYINACLAGKTKTKPVKVEKTPAEEFLNSLGIYGNNYCPKMINNLDITKDTPEVISETKGSIPKDFTIQVRNYISGKGNVCSFVKSTIDSFKKKEGIDSVDKITPELLNTYTKERQEWKTRAKVLNYHLVLGKTMRVKKSNFDVPDLNQYTKKYSDYDFLINWHLK